VTAGSDVTPRISVCIVTGRRHAQLDECLASLQDQQDPPSYELLVCADADPEVASTVGERFPDATVILVDKTLPSAGRNHLIEAATGDILLFLDDDITFGPGLLRRVDDLAMAHPEASVFGGPNETPPRSSRFQAVQGAVLASLVASGPVRRRYGAHPAGSADERWFILCNLAIRRDVMRRFDDELVCAEENALLAELHQRGEQMHYDPELCVYHERRPTLGGFVRQMHKYGRGRGQVIRRSPGRVHPAFLLPSVLVLYLVLAPLLAIWSSWTLLVGAAYLGAVTLAAGKIAHTLRRPEAAPLAWALTALLHVCYGSGVLRGIASPRPATLSTEEAARIREPVQ
jgi:succinoglycan biosynthesis protein ExoA